MASSCIVPVVQIENVRPHPNADNLELADILGYQVALPKAQYKSGDIGIYFPADTLIPTLYAMKFNIKQYLKGPEKNRVGRIQLRGEPSFGLITPIPEGCNWDIGDNVAEFFGCTKYEPPIKTTSGDAAKYDENIDPFVQKYTDIEHGKIFVDVFQEGEEVVATEKIHGTSVKIGVINGYEIASSMQIRRKRPEEDGFPANFGSQKIKTNTYWYPWSLSQVQCLINDLKKEHKIVLLYGEIYGNSIQKHFIYDTKNDISFRAFDILIDGKYLNWDEFKNLCDKYNVPTVPVLYRGPYNMKKILEITEGNTTIGTSGHIREGIVLKPIAERTHPKIGRVVLKYISTAYELSKHKDRDSKDV